MEECSTNTVSICFNTPSSPTSLSFQQEKGANDEATTPCKRQRTLPSTGSPSSSASPKSIDSRPIQIIYALSIKKGLLEVLHRLGCQFERRILPPKDVTDFAKNTMAKNAIIQAVMFLQNASLDVKRQGLKGLLERYGAQAKVLQINLYYDMNKVKYSWRRTVFQSIDPKERTRSLTVRIEAQDSRVGRRMNEADPSIAATMIALAQRRRKEEERVQNDGNIKFKTPTRFKVYLLALVQGSFFFYKTAIPSAFLDRLDRPQTSIESKEFKIEYSKVPLGTTESHIARIDGLFSSIFGSIRILETDDVV